MTLRLAGLLAGGAGAGPARRPRRWLPRGGRAVGWGHGQARRQKYAFAQQSSKLSGGLRYPSLPVLLRYQPLPRLTVLACPQFDLLIAADQDGTDITHDTEEWTVGAVGSLRVTLAERLALGVRYTQGLNHVGYGQRSAVWEFLCCVRYYCLRECAK